MKQPIIAASMLRSIPPATAPVTREQMGAFIGVTFSLALYAP